MGDHTHGHQVMFRSSESTIILSLTLDEVLGLQLLFLERALLYLLIRISASRSFFILQASILLSAKPNLEPCEMINV
jgi:hypothetical protein